MMGRFAAPIHTLGASPKAAGWPRRLFIGVTWNYDLEWNGRDAFLTDAHSNALNAHVSAPEQETL